MQKFLLTLIFIPFLLTAQDNSWVEVVTEKVGIDARGYRVWVADVNGDEYPDLLWGGDVGGVRNHIQLYLNTDDPNSDDPTDRVFVDVSKSSGIQQSRVSGNDNRITDVAALGDVDNDGDLDLVTSIYTHRLQNYSSNDPGDRTELLLNDGNGNFSIFENSGLNTAVFDESIDPGMTNVSSICFLDYDRDGNLDIYFGTWFTYYVGSSNDVYMPNILMKGNGDGTFEKVGAVGANEPLYGATVFDWNNDGWVDIATSSYCRTSSKLYMNMGGEFVDATELSGYNTQRLGGDNGQNLCQWEALPGDFDNDGDLDLLEVKVHGGYGNGEGRTTVTINGGDENDYLLDWDLSRINRIVNPQSHIGDMGGTWMDWDNDGDLDMMIGQDGYLQANPSGGVRLFFLLQDENGNFNEVTPDLGILPELQESHSMEPADFDLDGDLDLFITSTHRDTTIENGEQKISSYKRVELLENHIGNKSNWVAIKPNLENGMVYNGTRIELYQGDKIMTREIHQGGGHFGYQSPETQYFGLGNTARIDSVIIKFNGDTDKIAKLSSLTANRFYSIGSESLEVQEIIADNGNGYLNIPGITDFDIVDINTKVSRTITFQNPSQESLDINSIELSGASEFEISNESYLQTLNPGESGFIVVDFEPAERKAYQAVLSFSTDAANSIDGNYKVEIIGQGFDEKPIAIVDRPQIEFDPIFIGDSVNETLTLTNSGELDLIISDLFLEGDPNFEIISESIETIEPGEEISLDIRFFSDSLGEFNSELKILSNGFESQEITIPIYGLCNGPLPEPNFTNIPILNFGEVNIGSSSTKSFEIENTGNGQFIINSINMLGGENAFEFAEMEMPVIIEPDSKQSFDITFTPIDENLSDGSAKFNANVENDLEIFFRGNGIVASVNELSDGSNLVVDIFPNPITPNSQIIANLDNRSNLVAEFYIVDSNGKLLQKSESVNLYEGKNHLNFRVGNLLSGMYFIVLKTELGNIQTKFIVE